MEASRATDSDGYVVGPGPRGASDGSRVRHQTLRLQRPTESETDYSEYGDAGATPVTQAAAMYPMPGGYETVERPARGGGIPREAGGYLVPVTDGEQVYTAPGPGDSVVVTNPTFRGDVGGGDSSRSRERAASMAARLDLIKQRQASDRWRMINTCLSVVAIVLATVAIVRETDTTAAPSPSSLASEVSSEQSGDNAAMNDTVAALIRTVETLRQDMRSQAAAANATIAGLNATIAGLNATVAQHEITVARHENTIAGHENTIAELEATVEEQGGEIRNLTEQLAAERQSPVTVGNASGLLFSDTEVCGHVQVRNDADLRAMMTMLSRCNAFDAIKLIDLVSNVTLVNEAFGNTRIAQLVEISSRGFEVGSSPGNMFPALEVAARILITSTVLSTLGNAFPALRSVSGYIQIRDTDSLTTLGSAFPNLVSIGTSRSDGGDGSVTGLVITNNVLLLSAGNAFGSLQSVVGLKFDNNGASHADFRAFCTSADSILCPAAAPAEWDVNGDGVAHTSICCTAYCASSSC